jgi:capsular exopolysaccharide synthesis family protein
MDTANQSVDSENLPVAPDTKQLLLLVRERLWIICLCCVSGCIASIAYLQNAPKLFRTASVVKLEPRMHLAGLETDPGPRGGGDLGAATLVESFYSRLMADTALLHMNLQGDPAFAPQPLSPEQSRQLFRSALTLSPRKGTAFLDIRAQHTNPVMAQKLANGTAEAFLRLELEQRTLGARNLLEFLTSEGERLKARLQKSEDALQLYKETNRATSLEDRQDTVTAALKTQGNNLAEARATRIRLDGDVANMERLANNPQALLTLQSIAQHPTIVSTRSQITELESAVSTLRIRYTDRHPKLVQALSQLEDARAALEREVLEIQSVLRSDLERARANERNFEGALKEQETQALALNRQSIEYKVLARDVETDRAMYEAVLRRVKETDIAKGLQLGDLTIFERAPLPFETSGPQTLRILALGIAAGLISGLGIVMAGALMDKTWRSSDQLEKAIGIPLLAIIPSQPRRLRSHAGLPAFHSSFPQLLGGFRVLRAALHLGARRHGKTSFLFTSACAGDGKSFCAMGYAMTVAQQGLKTLLIDADLQSATLEKALLGSANLNGLAQVLEGTSSLESMIVTTSIPHVDLLPAGRQMTEAPEFFSESAIDELLRSAKQKYDCIVIDSPPIQGAGDALILAESVDSICLIVRYAKTEQNQALKALRLLGEHESKIEGVIFNAANISLLPEYPSLGGAAVKFPQQSFQPA